MAKDNNKKELIPAKNLLTIKLFYRLVFGLVLIILLIVILKYFLVDKKLSDSQKYFDNIINSKKQINQSEKNKLIKVVAPSTGKLIEISGVPLKAVSDKSVTAKNAYYILLKEAQKWSEDAVLVSLKSDQDIALDGRSSKWESFFISKNNYEKGWSAIFQDSIIIKKEEKESSANILTDPKFITDSNEAIRSGLGDFGASEVEVISIKLFQETMSGEWFWSIETGTGNLTLKAK